MGIKITVPNVNYSDGIDANVQAYLDISGITDEKITSSLNAFVKGLTAYGLWGKIDYIYPILGSNYNQIKYNLKNLSDDVLKDFVTEGDITNEINKGIVLKRTANANIERPVLPVDGTYLSLIRAGGHALYFINEDLYAGSFPQILSNTNSPSESSFYMTAKGLSTNPTLVVQSNVYKLNGVTGQMSRGVFSCSFDMAEGTFFSNDSIIGTIPMYTNQSPVPDVKVCLGSTTGTYAVNNTVSFISFGSVKLTNDEMLTYNGLISQLIDDVHGVSV